MRFLLVAVLALALPAAALAEPKTVRPDRAAIDRLLDEFIPAAVAQKDLQRGWELSAGVARTVSHDQWMKGDTSVQKYPAKGASFHGWTVNYSYPGDIGFDILLQPTKPSLGAWSFRAEAEKIRGRWRITTWYPVATFAPPGRTQTVLGPNDLGSADSAAAGPGPKRPRRPRRAPRRPRPRPRRARPGGARDADRLRGGDRRPGARPRGLARRQPPLEDPRNRARASRRPLTPSPARGSPRRSTAHRSGCRSRASPSSCPRGPCRPGRSARSRSATAAGRRGCRRSSSTSGRSAARTGSSRPAPSRPPCGRRRRRARVCGSRGRSARRRGRARRAGRRPRRASPRRTRSRRGSSST